MKTLYLVRHAKSDKENISPDLLDIDRPLNNRGYSNAYFMSALLKEKKLIPDLIISSSAVRALSTALIFARAFNYSSDKIKTEEKIYHGIADDYIKAAQSTDNTYKSVMIFGHNPEINSAANLLSDISVEHFPTTGIICFEFPIKHWNELTSGLKGELKFFDFPKNHI